MYVLVSERTKVGLRQLVFESTEMTITNSSPLRYKIGFVIKSSENALECVQVKGSSFAFCRLRENDWLTVIIYCTTKYYRNR